MRLSNWGIAKMVFVALALIGLAAYGIGKLTQGPSTKEEVCTSFNSLGQKALHANGFIDNAVFSQADDLADVAERYHGQPSLATDAEALHRIGDSNTTNMSQLSNATRHIASLCGHPLGIGQL